MEAEQRDRLRQVYNNLNNDPVQIELNRARQENHSEPSDTSQYIAHARAGMNDFRESVQDLPLEELV